MSLKDFSGNLELHWENLYMQPYVWILFVHINQRIFISMNMTNHEQRLLSRNIQPTAMRIRILSFMVENKSALGLPDLEETFTHADRTTLYRTLKTFLEHGLVHQINDASGITKYALCSENCTCSYPDDVHVHFYCTSCEQTFCFPHLGIPHYDLPENFIPSHGSFVITGSCPSCSSWSLQLSCITYNPYHLYSF